MNALRGLWITRAAFGNLEGGGMPADVDDVINAFINQDNRLKALDPQYTPLTTEQGVALYNPPAPRAGQGRRRGRRQLDPDPQPPQPATQSSRSSPLGVLVSAIPAHEIDLYQPQPLVENLQGTTGKYPSNCVPFWEV